MVLSQRDLNRVRTILSHRLPGAEVRAFGPRVTGRAWEGLDLDLVVMTQEPIPLHVMAELREDLAESDLPFPVDACEWRDLPERLKQAITAENEVVQEGGT